MACSSLSFPVTAKKPSSHAKSSPSSAVAAAAVSPSSSLHSSSSRSNQCSQLFLSSSRPSLSLRYDLNLIPRRLSRKPPNFLVVSSLGNKPEPLKVMISGAPASGKGTQCELISKKYGLVHIAAGDLLRAEVSAGSENGKQAKEFMEKGQLVPDEIVVMMVKDRLSQSDSQENGWLLDGYPRSLSQATALKGFGFQPDIFILLEVSEDNLVERVVGRRLDPVTGRIYHLKYSPPETEEIAARLTQRFDDTEEKVNGNASKDDVFAQIDIELKKLVEQKKATSGSVAA
ncbi:adenylate kinase, chloroplastic isoform X2 [Diospyros lotus]|uniref:adenylate kinase, chloroplastic isoform X2 n=1 Tax=Diospyros lotus TaxID=55363 RepID=UPI002259943A|nr:adenylate kinase, chloroplastic isoform X2 [Diospyros lotus]